MSLRKRVLFGRTAMVLGLAALGACGGGGGGSSRPAPTPAPTPSPTPAPRSTPTQSELDAETNRSNGVTSSNAFAAHEKGYTGEGQLVSVMDTGAYRFIENLSDNSGTGPDAADLVFEDRLSEMGGPLWGTDTPGDFTEHGTLVSSVIASADDGRGILGVAPDVDLLYYDYGDYCLASTCTEDQWQESFERYRVGMQEAIDVGAIVMNFSLGEDRFPTRMIPTTENAVAADMVIVISAGNEGQDDPHAMAQGFAELAPEHTIIAGAIDSAGNPASFTNLAGVSQNNYLMALGVGVVAYNNRGQLVTANGTSLSAPIITGAVALLSQAFPALSGAEIVDILFESAEDAGAPGIDPVYGRGILDIEAAFAPIGTTSVAGSARTTASFAGGVASPAMGDATGLLEGIAITDRYRRAFSADLGGFASRAGATAPLRALSQDGVETRSATVGDHRFGFTTAPHPDAREGESVRSILAASIELDLGAGTRVAFSKGISAEALAGTGEGIAVGFLLDSGVQRDGYHAANVIGLAASRNLGPLTLTLSGETGSVAGVRMPWETEDEDRYHRVRAAVGQKLGPLSMELGLSQLDEEVTTLGGSLAYAPGGSSSRFADGRLAWGFQDWTIDARYRRGWTDLRGDGDFITGGRLASEGWSAALAKGPFALRVAQPLRVLGGGYDALVPISFDYASMTPRYEPRLVSLAPSGREIDVEAAYGTHVGTARIDANLFWRRQPGHIAAVPDDKGAALRLRMPLR